MVLIELKQNVNRNQKSKKQLQARVLIELKQNVNYSTGSSDVTATVVLIELKQNVNMCVERTAKDLADSINRTKVECK